MREEIQKLTNEINAALAPIVVNYSKEIIDKYVERGGFKDKIHPDVYSEDEIFRFIPTLIELNNALIFHLKKNGYTIRSKNDITGLPNQPSTKKGIKHYAEGAAKAVKAMTMPETDESKARLEVCKGCDKWTGTSCKVCGCFVNLKVKIPEEKCPEGKW